MLYILYIYAHTFASRVIHYLCIYIYTVRAVLCPGIERRSGGACGTSLFNFRRRKTSAISSEVGGWKTVYPRRVAKEKQFSTAVDKRKRKQLLIFIYARGKYIYI